MNVTTQIVWHTCPSRGCGIEFAVQNGYDDRRREKGDAFYCPNGHAMSYRDSTEAKLKRERERAGRLAARLEQERAEHATTERRRRAAKGQLTKVRRRVAHGVCPGCNRTFDNLAAHMASQHPDFATAGDAPAGDAVAS